MAAPLASMAWRNLWRNRRRTLVTLSSIGFGTMLAILFTGMGDSNFSDMIDLAARMGGGHVTLQHPEYLELPTFSRTVDQADRLREVALADPQVERVTLRIAGNVMVSSAENSQGAGFIAFDPGGEDVETLSLLEALEEGSLFSDAGARGIVLGAGLAERLGVGVGKKVVYTLTDKRGEIVQESARVLGLVRTGSPSVDSALCLLPLERVQKLLGYGESEVLQVALFLRDQRAAQATAARLSPRVAPQAAALPWFVTQPELSGFIAMKIAGARVMEVVIMLLVAAGIFNTLFVSVMERMREFGIMVAIGFSPSQLFRLVMWESLWLAAVGLALGALVTAAPYAYLARVGVDLAAVSKVDVAGSEVAGVAVTPVMHVGIYPDHLVAIVAAAVLATLAAGLYPAWSAGRVAPAESIRIL
jgi:ABC-type lipoprotein release transport system permease subunit